MNGLLRLLADQGNNVVIFAASATISVASSHSNAASVSFVDGEYFGFDMPGTSVELTLSPPKPEPGMAFSVRVTGVATQTCPPDRFEDAYFAERFGQDLQMVYINAQLSECTESDLPIRFEVNVPVKTDDFWDSFNPEDPAIIRLRVLTGMKQVSTAPIFEDTTAIWDREIDLVRGTHTVPPQLGSGYWVSEERPNEGLLIQQQGDRLVAYEMAYGDALTADGNHVGGWTYTDARFAGDSTNGQAITIARPDLDSPDVTFEKILTSSFIVDDVNHVQALFDARPTSAGIPEVSGLFYKAYRRWVFNQDQQPFPVTVPDFSGEWTLLRFDGATELERDAVVLGEGAWLDSNRWRFMAVDGSASLICKVTITTGLGHCIYQAEGETEKLRFEIADFNGNIGQGAWLDAGDQPVSDGIFLRAPYELP